MIQLSVCIPMFRSKYIGWLALESMCRQENINFEWELIVAEETFDEAFGKDEIMTYKRRLEDVGCVRIEYIGLEKWVPLSNKYVIMVNSCSDSSKIFAGCAADIFAPPARLKTQYDIFITDSDVDFCASPKTIFYDIVSEKTFLYNVALRSRKADGSNRAFRMEIMKNLPIANRRKGVDGWTWNFANDYVKSKDKKFKYHPDTSNNWNYGLNVHGLNNISHDRIHLFNNFGAGISKCPIDINVTIPKDIMDKLKDAKKYIKIHKIGLP